MKANEQDSNHSRAGSDRPCRFFFALRSGPTTSGDAAPPADEPQERAYDVAIEDGTMGPAEINVEEGDQVTLRLTSDHPLEIHLHGYNLEVEVLPGEETVLSFEEITGRSEIEDPGAPGRPEAVRRSPQGAPKPAADAGADGSLHYL